MFLDLLQSPRKVDVGLRELPPIPETGWRLPSSWPDLTRASVIAYDTETKELDFDHGPGWGRGKGHIVGISVAAIWPDQSRGKWYFPVRHEVERDWNLPAEHVFAWLKHQLETTPTIPKVGANLLYDNGWLGDEGIIPVGPLYDVQFAEALIDEIGRTALDYLGLKYANRGKDTDQLKDWIFKAYPRANLKTWRGYIWRAPPRLVGPYAEEDADLPLDVLPRQWAIMQSEGTLQLFKRECQSIPMLIKMRQQGITVNMTTAETIRAELEADLITLYAKISSQCGFTVNNVVEKGQLKRIFDAIGIDYPKTSSGQPSFRKEWLSTLADHGGYGLLVNEIRECEKLRDTFIDSYILDRAVSEGNSLGKIYCSFHPLRNDDAGAKTGRYSSSHPNLQNLPSRTKRGKRVRDIFVPDYNHICMHKKDHSQIEYRVFAHFATGHRSDEIRARYVNDPSTDYHDDTMRDVGAIRRINIAAMTRDEKDRFRKPIKNVNFGLLYGQTEDSLAYKAGWNKEESVQFFNEYHTARPFVKTTMQAIQHEVQYNGYITTIAGRRTRFNVWEAVNYADRKASGPMSHDVALRMFGGKIRRAYAYRGINYRFQGSAADILKEGMLQCYEQGVYDYIGYPKLQVHDELDWSKYANDNAHNEAYRYVTHVMEQAIKLSVPLKVDSSEGATWGQCA